MPVPDSLLGRGLWALGIALGLFVLFTAATTAAVGGFPLVAIGVVVAGLLLYWTWTYRKETDSAAETAQMVGEEASGFFGGIVDWFSAAVLSIGFVLITLSGQIMDLVDLLVQMATTAPVASGSLGIAGALAFLDWNGSIGLQLQEWVVIGVALIVVGVIVRRYLYGEVDV